ERMKVTRKLNRLRRARRWAVSRRMPARGTVSSWECAWFTGKMRYTRCRADTSILCPAFYVAIWGGSISNMPMKNRLLIMALLGVAAQLLSAGAVSAADTNNPPLLKIGAADAAKHADETLVV